MFRNLLQEDGKQRSNASSLARKLPKVASTDKVRKVNDKNLELVFKSVMKIIPRKIVKI